MKKNAKNRFTKYLLGSENNEGFQKDLKYNKKHIKLIFSKT